MRRFTLGWTIAVVLAAVFWLWHVPRGGPLTAEEIATLTEQAGLSLEQLPADMARFFETDDGQPFFMVNIIEDREHAEYPNGQFPEITDVGDAARAYAIGVVPELLRRGSYPVFIGRPLATLITDFGADTARFDSVAIVRYRSRRDFLEIMAGERFQQVVVHKWASVAGTIVQPAQRHFAMTLGWIVVFLLLGLLWPQRARR